jgi:hypothetical protein
VSLTRVGKGRGCKDFQGGDNWLAYPPAVHNMSDGGMMLGLDNIQIINTIKS